MDSNGIKKDFNLEGKIVLVTGSAKGIGKTIARLFAKEGADIVLVDKDEGVKEVSDEIEKFGKKCLPLVYDLTISKNIKLIVEECITVFKKIDILVNNAGVVFLDYAENLSKEYWDMTISINLTVPFLLSQAVGKEMIKRRSGKIINIASQAGIVALDKHIAYSTSKAGIIQMTKAFALEWAKFNVNVNSISPTVVLTELGKKAWEGKVGEEMKQKIPFGRFAEPEEIARVALFLASYAPEMITGENIIIDGGYTLQ